MREIESHDGPMTLSVSIEGVRGPLETDPEDTRHNSNQIEDTPSSPPLHCSSSFR